MCLVADALSDHLKYFVERAGLFTGTRGKQIAGRATMIRTSPFPYQQEWKALVATMERTLRLHHHQPDTLVGLDRYLHQRSGGMIGSLSHLIRAAAISATLDGSERITRELLDGIRIDHAAESATRRASSHH